MPFINHEHNDKCPYGDSSYLYEYLIKAAPDILWFEFQDIGDYSGTIYAIGVLNRKILYYVDSYGSCSFCGAWGQDSDSAEPKNEKEVLERSILYDNETEALKGIALKDNNYERPNKERLISAINKAQRFINGEEIR